MALNAKQQLSRRSERKFEKFCAENEIDFINLEMDQAERQIFLKDLNGKCPDYFCKKDGGALFVEVKTHTMVTNTKREHIMQNTVGQVSEAFNPISELKIPFEGYLRDASKKFKNIKNDYGFPRALLLDGLFVNKFDVRAIFNGWYDGYNRTDDGKFIYAGLVKNHLGILDSTGSNVSAIIFWNNDTKRYEGVANPKAIISLPEADFKKFF